MVLVDIMDFSIKINIAIIMFIIIIQTKKIHLKLFLMILISLY